MGSEIYRDLFADPEVAALFSDRAEIAAMVRFEAALARAQGKAEVIPAAAADAIVTALAGCEIAPEALVVDTARDGLPVPGLVRALQAAVGNSYGPYVHWGATSQDVMDTGLILRLREALALMEARLVRLTCGFADLASEHRATVIVGRTRTMQGVPTTFGLKAAGWLSPLVRFRGRLPALRREVLALSFGGAVGNLSALGDDAMPVAEVLAGELDLALPDMPWHVQRDRLLVLGGWCAGLAAALGKFGADVGLMAQSEVGELKIAGGGSSTMPNKVNPIGAEVLVAQARAAAGDTGTLHQAAIQEHERGGAGWSLEWTCLPRLVMACAGALKTAEDLLAVLAVDRERMAANLAASNGLVFAERAAFALARQMPKPDAQRLVKAACRTALKNGRHLRDVLEDAAPGGIDWAEVFDPLAAAGASDVLIDRVLAGVAEADN